MSKRTYNKQSGLPRGVGTVDQLPSGRWRARTAAKLSVGTFSTVEEAQNALLHRRMVDDPETVVDLLERFIVEHRSEWRTGTVENYEWFTRSKIAPFIGHVFVHDLDQPKLRLWWSDLAGATGGQVRNGRKLDGQVTRAKVWRFFAMVLAQADADGLLCHPISEPVTEAGKERSPERHLVRPDQVVDIIDALPENRQVVAVLSAYAGLRWGEITALPRHAVDVDGRTIAVRSSMTRSRTTNEARRELPKTEAGVRIVPVDQTVMDVIGDHLERFVSPEPTALVVATRSGGPVAAPTFGKQWKRAVIAAGLDHIEPSLRLHDLRHFALTRAASTGAPLRDVMAFSGHASPRAAMRYQHRASQDLNHLAMPLDRGDGDGVVVELRPGRSGSG